MNFKLLKCAYIRGYIIKNKIDASSDVINKNLLDLDIDDINYLENLGRQLDLKLYYFKEKEDLSRVHIVLGFLKCVYPNSLLDVGSGRGVFLFPLLREFPYTSVTSIDILDKRIELLNYISLGGVTNLKTCKGDIVNFDMPDNSFEVVTLLEVLEHIPSVENAIKNACRLAKNFIIVTVPSKEDDNPEHIHLLTKDKLTKMFNDCGVTNLKFGGVNGHLYMVARK